MEIPDKFNYVLKSGPHIEIMNDLLTRDNKKPDILSTNEIQVEHYLRHINTNGCTSYFVNANGSIFVTNWMATMCRNVNVCEIYY